MKFCKCCGESKTKEEFYKNNALPDKLTRYCKMCSKIKERETHKKNPIKKWEHRHKSLKTCNDERVTLELFTRLINEQNNKCGICQTDMKKPCIDHNHTSGIVRMLLCTNCNIMIGMAKENTLYLSRAIDYLNKFNK
jgi:hypothetical protein